MELPWWKSAGWALRFGPNHSVLARNVDRRTMATGQIRRVRKPAMQIKWNQLKASIRTRRIWKTSEYEPGEYGRRKLNEIQSLDSKLSNTISCTRLPWQRRVAIINGRAIRLIRTLLIYTRPFAAVTITGLDLCDLSDLSERVQCARRAWPEDDHTMRSWDSISSIKKFERAWSTRTRSESSILGSNE